MFLKKTHLDKSAISGIGLYADEDISIGEVVYKHSSKLQLVLTQQEFDALSEDERKTFSHYGYFSKGKWTLDFDDIRFLNHNNTPNLALRLEGIIANRDIKRGEELTQNYLDFEDEIRF